MKTKSDQSPKRVVTAITIAICSVTALISGVMLFKELSEYQTGSSAYDSLTEFVIPPTPSKVSGELLSPVPDTEDEWPVVDFDALKEINPDIVAWIICGDTVINYPVVQGQDNDYYLHHIFDGRWNESGCLFVDCGNMRGFADDNTVIYGHNMKNKSMFAVLVEYKSQAFFETHSRMLLLAPEGNYTIELFAGYVTGTEDESWKLSFSDRDEFSDWISRTQARSTFESDVKITADDHIITLSTCSYEFDNARYIVVGKLIPQ